MDSVAPHTRPSTVGLILGLTLAICLFVAPNAHAQKTDIVFLENGDKLTGEIKRMEYGMLRLSTSFLSTVEIKWEHVQTLTSDKGLQIELDTGRRHFGALAEPSEFRKLRVIGLTEFIELDLIDVVRITPIKEGFFKKVDGSLSLGVSYTKASDVAQLNLNGSATHRTRKNQNSLTLDSIITAQTEQPTSKRNELSYTYQRYLKRKWFLRGDTGWNQNDELGIESRVSLGAGGGRQLIQTNRQALQASSVLIANSERVRDGEDSRNLELGLELSYRVFRYDTPKTDLNISLSVYPNLSNFGRVRGTFSSNVRQELIKDFFWDLQFYYDYDSEPASTTALKDDYGVVTSFGYSF